MSQAVTIFTVADLHRNRKQYQELEDAVAMHRPDIVVLLGDFLDASGDETGKLTPEQCAQSLNRLPCLEVVFIRGNHEDIAILDFAHAWTALGRDFHLVEGRIFVHGPLALVGFPCLTQQPECLFQELPLDANRWLPKLLRKIGPAGRALWLMHEPPCGTPLSQAVGSVAGCQEWTAAIERFLPWLVIFGHDHTTPIELGRWHHTMPGGTVCANVGQNESGPLRYCMVVACFSGQEPALPLEMTVTAHPKRDAIRLPPVG